jgi:hypothetical protein
MGDAAGGRDRLESIARSIWSRERALGFAGPDPYDGLNSRLLGPALSKSRILRLALIQAVKRCPFDPRRILMIPPGTNPKGLALFLSGLTDFPGIDPSGDGAGILQDVLVHEASRPDGSPLFPPCACGSPSLQADAEAGWGYDFPWQGRAFFQPAGFPTVVCTSFVVDSLCESGCAQADALLEASVRFVRNSLDRYECGDGVCFSYSPRDASRVYNASLFAAKILARGHAAGMGGGLDAESAAAADFVVSRQSPDGSWVYGEAPHWQWVDNLHTGFVLETLMFLGRTLGRDGWDDAIRRGLAYYAENLFNRDGTALYHPGGRFPVDPHSYAQGILTWLAAARNGFELHVDPESIARRAVELLWDGRRRGFRMIRFRGDTSRTIYARWSQAWMFRALAALLKEDGRS